MRKTVDVVSHLKKVNVIGAQPLERLINSLQDILTAHPRTLATVPKVLETVGTAGYLSKQEHREGHEGYYSRQNRVRSLSQSRG